MNSVASQFQMIVFFICPKLQKHPVYPSNIGLDAIVKVILRVKIHTVLNINDKDILNNM